MYAGEPVVTRSRQPRPPKPGVAPGRRRRPAEACRSFPELGRVMVAGCRGAGGAQRRHRRRDVVRAEKTGPAGGRSSSRIDVLWSVVVWCQSNEPRLTPARRARRLPPAGPASRSPSSASSSPVRSPGMARILFRSCRRVQASRQGRRDAIAARSATRLGAHGQRHPHQTQSPSVPACACRPSIVCASCQSRRSTTSAGSVRSTLTIPHPSARSSLRPSVTTSQPPQLASRSDFLCDCRNYL